ncbi:terminase small subunit [Eubacteriales bacterium OttesenSCG-928-N14]|nr:terminase small subunit [Eubacteriales bacterium OttesenSCG-928-N14]
MANGELNMKQQIFCNAVAGGQSVQLAAVQAGYSRYYGDYLMRQEKIQAAIEGQRQRAASEQDGAQAVLKMYEKMAFCDIKDFVRFGTREENGKRVGYVELKEDAQVDGQLIEEIVISSNGVPKIKLYDKEKALEKLEKYYDLLPDQWKRNLEEKKLKAATDGKSGVQLKVFSSIPRPGDDDAAN